MKALVLEGPGRLAWADAPVPVPGAGERLVRVTHAGLCGADLSALREGRPVGAVLGHEAVGTVEGMGPVVVDPCIPCGACPACAGGRENLCADARVLGMFGTPGVFAEYVSAPVANLYRLEADPAEVGVFAEPMAVSARAASWCDLRAGGTAAVYGAGVQGLLFTLRALEAGMRVAVCDPLPDRLRLAAAFGAETVAVEPLAFTEHVWAMTGGRGADAVVDAARDGAVRQHALDLTRPGGTLLLLGMRPAAGPDLAQAVRREIRIQGTFGYTAADFRTGLAQLKRFERELVRMATVAAMECGPMIAESLCRSAAGLPKVVLRV